MWCTSTTMTTGSRRTAERRDFPPSRVVSGGGYRWTKPQTFVVDWCAGPKATAALRYQRLRHQRDCSVAERMASRLTTPLVPCFKYVIYFKYTFHIQIYGLIIYLLANRPSLAKLLFILRYQVSKEVASPARGRPGQRVGVAIFTVPLPDNEAGNLLFTAFYYFIRDKTRQCACWGRARYRHNSKVHTRTQHTDHGLLL